MAARRPCCQQWLLWRWMAAACPAQRCARRCSQPGPVRHTAPGHRVPAAGGSAPSKEPAAREAPVRFLCYKRKRNNCLGCICFSNPCLHRSPPQEQPDTLSRGADKAGGGPGSCSCPHLTPGVRRLYLGTPQPAVRSPLGHSAGHTFSGRQTAAPPAPCAAPRPGLHTAVPLPAHRLNSAAATRGPGLSSGQGLGGTEPQGTKRGAGSSPRPGHTQPCGTATVRTCGSPRGAALAQPFLSVPVAPAQKSRGSEQRCRPSAG